MALAHGFPNSNSFRRVLHFALGGLVVSLSAQANLQVYPTRLVLDNQKKVATVSLRNAGDKATEYQVRTIFYSMDASGQMTLVDKPAPEQRSATKLIRYSPRRTQLAPQTEQVVRVMFAGPRNLSEGEYRAHLLFEPVGSTDPAPQKGGKKNQVNMQLEARVAIAIPVVFRQGTPKSEISLSDLKLTTPAKGPPGFEMSLSYTGNAFPYGDVHLYFVRDGKKKREQLALVRGLSSYAPKRKVAFALNTFKGSVSDLKGGKLIAEFRSHPVAPKRDAETEEQASELIASIQTPL